MEILSHTVLFTPIKAYHWNAIENTVLVIWLMSGMLVVALDIVAMNGPERARCHCMFPHCTCSTKGSAPLKWNQKSGPSSISHVWGTINIYRKEAPVMGSVEFSQQHNVLATKTLCCWENSNDHIKSALTVYVQYDMA